MSIASSGIWHITYLDMTLRILAALALGGLIGFEREVNNHAAGFRTHILVCVGSATIMLLSIYGFGEFANELNVRMDPARLAAQVITGIGFLGAGAIIRTGSYVSGLTTAASIWVVAAIGLCIGAGFYYGAVLVAFLVLVSLFLFNKWEKGLMRKFRKHEMSIEINDRPGLLGEIIEKISEQGVQISNLAVQSSKEKEDRKRTLLVRFSVKIPRKGGMVRVIDHIASVEDVLSIDIPAFSGISKAGV